MSDPNAIYWVTAQAVFGSIDGGRSFAPLFTRAVGGGWQSTGVDNVVMHGIASSATNPNRVYAFFDDLGCWRTDDGGASWVNCNPSNTTVNYWGATGGETRSLVVDPANADVVWATFEGQGRSHVLLSTAAGAPTSWVDVSAGLPATTALSGLSLAPGGTAGQRTLFVTADGDVYCSADGGQSWSLSLDCDGCRVTAIDRFNPALVYAGGEAGLRLSTDGGATWIEVNEGMTWPFALAVAVVPGDPSLVYVGSPGTGLATRRFALPAPTATATATPLPLPVPVAPRGVITTNVPVFVWDGVAGVVEYRIWVNEYATPNVPGKINQLYSAAAAGCPSGGRCSVSPGVSFASVNAEWWVTAIMPDGSERLSASATFTVQPTP